VKAKSGIMNKEAERTCFPFKPQ